MKKFGKIKVPARNVHKRVAKGDISKSLRVMKQLEINAINNMD